MTPSLLRLAEHSALSTLTLDGTILDLGGEKGSRYQSLIRGTHSFVTVNISEKARPDHLHDLEEKLPFPDASYDHALLMNVLEHVFEYRALLREARRAVRPGGKIVILVPFLFPFHPSPQDFHRFTSSALEKELAAAGMKDIRITALGSGVFSARLLFLDRLLPAPLRYFNFYVTRHIALCADWAAASLSRAASKKYQPQDYALGFFATGTV